MRRFPGHSNPPPPPQPPVIHKTIKAKALRKKGTDWWYWYDFPRDRYLPSELPELVSSAEELSSNTPTDSELIDITIIIEE